MLGVHQHALLVYHPSSRDGSVELEPAEGTMSSVELVGKPHVLIRVASSSIQVALCTGRSSAGPPTPEIDAAWHNLLKGTSRKETRITVLIASYAAKYNNLNRTEASSVTA
jgi:hypothetical protein